MRRRRYIEIDPAWWSEAPAPPARVSALLRALAENGWSAREARGRVRLVRRFATDSEHRAAIAQARFTVAAHLADGLRAASWTGPEEAAASLS